MTTETEQRLKPAIMVEFYLIDSAAGLVGLELSWDLYILQDRTLLNNSLIVVSQPVRTFIGTLEKQSDWEFINSHEAWTNTF